MRILILAALIMSACATVPKCPTSEMVKSSDTRTTTGRWIVFNKKHFASVKGDVQMPPSTKGVLAQSVGAKNFKKLGDINAYAFDAEPDKMQAFTLKTMSVNDEWVFQREFVHHILDEQLYKIVPASCPPVTPVPIPQPTEPAKSWGISRVHANEAMAKVDTSQIKAGVIDTGLDLNHPNKGNIVATVSMTGEPVSPDIAMHGTHVSSTVFGRGGVNISVAKGYFCKGLSNNGSGTSSALASCLAWMKQQGVQVVSNSWGSTQSDPIINQAVQQLAATGAQVFFAAGNDGGPTNWPAKLAGSVPNVWAVAASDEGDRIANFSSRGPEVKVIEPGVNIIGNKPGGGTQGMTGSSMSTPHGAGICVFGVARGIKPCIKTTGLVGGFPFGDALETAR